MWRFVSSNNAAIWWGSINDTQLYNDLYFSWNISSILEPPSMSSTVFGIVLWWPRICLTSAQRPVPDKPFKHTFSTYMFLVSLNNFQHVMVLPSSFPWTMWKQDELIWNGFVVRGESPGCRLISTASMLEWLWNLLPHHSQGSSTERWSRNTPRVVTARVFYVLRDFLTSPFILNNSVETAAPFNVVSHPRCSEPRN